MRRPPSFGAVALGNLDRDGSLHAVVGDNSALDTSVWLNEKYSDAAADPEMMVKTPRV